LLGYLIEFLRDLALLAAASGVAWWCWDQWRDRAARRDEAARLQLAAERQAADLKMWIDRLDARTAGMADRLEEIAAQGRAAEARAAGKLRVHRLLQATSDPFLSFTEIERAMGQLGDFAGALTGDGPTPESAAEPLAADALRRVLIELVSDGVVAQLDRDRYFIASDYEAGDDDEPSDTG
jgi:hypothetical protein